MSYDDQIRNMAAESLAMQSLLVAILKQISERSLADKMLLQRAFSASIHYLETQGAKDPRVGGDAHKDKAVMLVREMRTLLLGEEAA